MAVVRSVTMLMSSQGINIYEIREEECDSAYVASQTLMANQFDSKSGLSNTHRVKEQ